MSFYTSSNRNLFIMLISTISRNRFRQSMLSNSPTCNLLIKLFFLYNLSPFIDTLTIPIAASFLDFFVIIRQQFFNHLICSNSIILTNIVVIVVSIISHLLYNRQHSSYIINFLSRIQSINIFKLHVLIMLLLNYSLIG